MRLALAVLVLAAFAPAAEAAPTVQITRASHGIPHIEGASYYRIRLRARTTRGRTITVVRRARTCAGRRS